MLALSVPTADGMEALGASLAPLLRAGDLVRLDGELGAGKTTFTRGLGEALETREPVTSPTFVLARVHPTAPDGVGGGVPLLHVDAYRLGSAIELDDLDLDLAGSITVVEWGKGRLPDDLDALVVAIERAPTGSTHEPEETGTPDDPEDEPRTVRISATGPRSAELADAWAGLRAAN